MCLIIYFDQELTYWVIWWLDFFWHSMTSQNLKESFFSTKILNKFYYKPAHFYILTSMYIGLVPLILSMDIVIIY